MDWNTLETVLSTYSVDQRGIITDCGKFEDEHLSTAYYWNMSMDGCAEELSYEDGSPTVYILEIEPDERGAFGFANDATHFAMTECENVFVSGDSWSQARYDQYVADYAAMQDEEEEG